MTTFKELQIGDTFDFIRPDTSTTFYERCTKVSARKYAWTESGGTFDAEVGSINVPVYHVVPAKVRSC